MDNNKDKQSNIVHQWNIEVKMPSAAEQYIENYNHCCMCGTELSFAHVTDFMYNYVTEEAECPTCSVKLKSKHHVLQ